MRITCIIPFCNQTDLLKANLEVLARSISEPDTNIVLIDNNSDSTVSFEDPRVTVLHLNQNTGNYPTLFEYRKFEELKNSNLPAEYNIDFGDILCFIHSDFIIWEKGWDTRVKKAFEENEKLGLVGCIGSDEIDVLGGRGAGTSSNFMGEHLSMLGKPDSWGGSKAEVHGKRLTGQMKAAVVDGCSMFFRKSVLDQIKQREDFPPHHFYDRLLSCEVQELGYEVAVLGLECDHISGQTANTQNKWQETAKEWYTKRHEASSVAEDANWDSVIYQEAERQWLTEYRDRKRFIPFKVLK